MKVLNKTCKSLPNFKRFLILTMSENSDYSVLGSTFNNPNGNETATADALSAALRIGSMVFSSWSRSIVSKLFF